MPFPIIAAICWVCGSVAACYCAKKAHDAYQKHHDTEQKKLEYSLEEKKLAKERNDKLQPQQEEKEKEYEKQEKKNKQLEKDLEEAKSKAKDPTLSKEQQQYWRNRTVVLEEELGQGKNKSKSLLKEIKDLKDQIDKNNEIINSTDLVGDKKKSWVWEFLTLENILIMLAVYALYNIVRDERRH